MGTGWAPRLREDSMRKKALVSVALGLTVALTAGAAIAGFKPKFDLKLSDTKVKGNPQLDIHLEFAGDDEEIGNFAMKIPKGFSIASDEDVPNDEEIGAGDISIEAGPGCSTGPEGAIPVSTQAPIPATIYEKARSDDEADAGVHAVWLLDLEPLNRVRLLITGSKKKGWTVSGAPTPSPYTCNPLTVDLTINAESATGVPLVTNAAKKGTYKIVATITSQDSPALQRFVEKVKLTK
jgi:hypothetical protein